MSDSQTAPDTHFKPLKYQNIIKIAKVHIGRHPKPITEY